MNRSMTDRSQQVAREDLVMFINACFACTGQREFYTDRNAQRVSIDFLHQYILGNYRRLYARTLAAGINHFNQGQIILNLLATGRNLPVEDRTEEGELITAALCALPAQRAWGVLEQMRARGINNRRSRALVRDFFTQRRDIAFDLVKYRAKARAIVTHAHLHLPDELGEFLFGHWQQHFSTPLFEAFRKAHFSAEAIYALPFTIAEGFAVKHKIPRAVFLKRIEGMMTQGEKLRLHKAGERTKGVALSLDLGRQPLTRLLLYLLSLAPADRYEQRELLQQGISQAVQRTLQSFPLRLGRVAAVLDNSYSSSGSSEKRRRPLAVALGVHYLLQAAAQDYYPIWTTPVADPLELTAGGQTDLALPLLCALEHTPDLVVIVSDGCENDPPQGAAELLRVYRKKLDPQHRVAIIHCNPVFDADNLSLRSISPLIPAVGLRDAEDLATMLGFARFANGATSLAELEAYLQVRTRQMTASAIMPETAETP